MGELLDVEEVVYLKEDLVEDALVELHGLCLKKHKFDGQQRKA